MVSNIPKIQRFCSKIQISSFASNVFDNIIECIVSMKKEAHVLYTKYNSSDY